MGNKFSFVRSEITICACGLVVRASQTNDKNLAQFSLSVLFTNKLAEANIVSACNINDIMDEMENYKTK